MKPLSYTQFLWKSDNLHGLHSPFVFAFTEQGLYDRYNPIQKRRYDFGDTGLNYQILKTLYKTISYFKAYKLIVLGDNAIATTEVIQEAGQKLNAKIWFFSPNAPIPGTIDLAYLSGSNSESIQNSLAQLLPNVSDTTVCVIGNIHSSAEMEEAWEDIKKDPNVTVTIDTYHLGLVFFRRGQANQHFIIRTSTSKILDAFLGVKKLWGLLG